MLINHFAAQFPHPSQLEGKYGDMDVHDARKQRVVEEENARMKRIIANQAMQTDILKEINARKWQA